MDKIVGKQLIFLILLFSNFISNAQSFLRIVDQRGIPIKEAYVNTPFKVELVLENGDRAIKIPRIPGLEAFRVSGNETRMSSKNGQATTVYAYHLNALKPGNYTLGPINDASLGAIESITFKVDIAQEQQPHERAEQPFARLRADKKQVMIGEKVHFSLRFYYTDSSMSLENVHEPDIQNSCFNNRKGPVAGKEIIQKKTYDYIEWEWDGFPREPGTLVIPGYCLDFSSAQEQDEPDFFSLFFQRRKLRKRIYSNSLELNVEALPAYSGEVHGIGCFTNFSLAVQPEIARLGEGIVLTLEIVGDNNLEKLDIFPLNAVPDELKWYDSKNYCTPYAANDSRVKKSFEYIVQGLKAGDWEIPSQKFTYFDTKKRQYKTLQTSPKIITITPNAAPSAPSSNEPEHNSVNTTIEMPWQADQDLHPLNVQGALHGYRERVIPWWFFSFLFFVPVLLWLTRRVSWYKKNDTRNFRKNCFDKAHASLAAAEKNYAYTQLYPIFLELLMALLSLSEAAITEELLERKMEEKKFSQEQIKEWRLFFLHISEYAFSPIKPEYEHQEPFKQARRWLDQFESHL